MNKTNKTLFLTLCLLLGDGLSITSHDAKIINASTSLQSLIDNATDGTTILLNENSKTPVNVNANKNIVIDLNGYDISAKITNNGVLKIINSKDVGSFNISSNANETISAIDNYGTLTIDGVNIYCQGLSSNTIANSITNKNGGILTFLDGEIISTSKNSKWGFGINNETGGIIKNISGGSIKSHIAFATSASNAVTINNSGTIENISGGKLLAETNGNNGYSTALRNNSGGIIKDITGATLKAWANNTNGSAKAYGLYNVGGGTINKISDGLLHGDSTAAEWAFGIWNQGLIKEISNGSFVATIDHNKNAPNAIAIANDGKIDLISGGTYYAYSTTPSGSTIGIRTRYSGSVLSSITGGAIYINKENASHYFLSESSGITTFASGYSLSNKSSDSKYKYVLNSSYSYVEEYDENINLMVANVYNGSNLVKTYNLYGSERRAASINGVAYPTIQNAIDNAITNDTILVEKDIDEDLIIGNNKKVNVNLNNHTLNTKITNDGTLNLYNGYLTANTNYLIQNNNSLSLDNIEITFISSDTSEVNIKNEDNASLSIVNSKVRNIANSKNLIAINNMGYISTLNANIETLCFTPESNEIFSIVNNGTIDNIDATNIIIQADNGSIKTSSIINNGNIKNIIDTNLSLRLHNSSSLTSSAIENNATIQRISNCNIDVFGNDNLNNINNLGTINSINNSLLSLTVLSNEALSSNNIVNNKDASLNIDGGYFKINSEEKGLKNIINNGTLQINFCAFENNIDTNFISSKNDYNYTKLSSNVSYIKDNSSIVIELTDDNNLFKGYEVYKNSSLLSKVNNYNLNGYYVEHFKDENDNLILYNKLHEINKSCSLKVVYQKAPMYYFLGSSVTYGATNNASSFVNEIASLLNCYTQKEAISGTTLANNGSSSYVARMMSNFDKKQKVESFIVQLSTNDVSQNKPLGVISNSKNIESFDNTTVLGAIEFIIAYVKLTWNCDVIFYTNPNYNNSAYANLINKLYEIKNKWDIGIIDFYNYVDMDIVDSTTLSSYMSDAIHPNKYGYEWMGKEFAKYLQIQFSNKHNDVLI